MFCFCDKNSLSGHFFYFLWFYYTPTWYLEINDRQEAKSECASTSNSRADSDYESRKVAVEGLLKMKDSTVEKEAEKVGYFLNLICFQLLT